MRSKKPTIKECYTLLRSCISMLDEMYKFTSSDIISLRLSYYCSICHIMANPLQSLVENYGYIIALYNEINQLYLNS